MGAFAKLAVYQQAADLSDEIHAATPGWSSFDRWTVGLQLVRAVDSIGANIAEASGRGTDADQRRLLLVARGSLHEVEHWLNRTRARDMTCPPDALGRAHQVGRMLNGLINPL